MFCRWDLQRQVRILEVLIEGRRRQQRPQLIWITLQMVLKMGCILKCIYIHTYIYIYTRIFIYTYIYIYIYLYIHIYIYVYLFIIYWLSVYIIYWGILMGKMIINRLGGQPGRRIHMAEFLLATARVKLSMRDEDPLAGAPWQWFKHELGWSCWAVTVSSNFFLETNLETYPYHPIPMYIDIDMDMDIWI